MSLGYGEVWRDSQDNETVMVVREAMLNEDSDWMEEYMVLILVEGMAGATHRVVGDLAVVDLKWRAPDRWSRLDDAE